jgi:tetrahydromethanopterin S-methyltransferase subunit F
LLKFLQVATIVGIFIGYRCSCKFIFFNFLFFLLKLISLSRQPFSLPHNSSPLKIPNSGKAATLCSHSQLRWRFFLFESRSSLSSTVFSKKSMGLGLGFVAAVLVLKVVMGLGFVAVGAAKDLVTAVDVGGCWGNWLLPWM